jgi:hypothetical protein
MNNILVGQEVEFKGCKYIATVVQIKGKNAILTYDNTANEIETFTKRLSSLKQYKKRDIYYDEQEIANRNRIYNDGQVVFSLLGTSGQNGNYLYINGDIVKQ